MLTLKAARVMAITLCATWLPLASEAAVVVDVEIRSATTACGRGSAAAVGYVWVPGYWRWNGHRHVWSRAAGCTSGAVGIRCPPKGSL